MKKRLIFAIMAFVGINNTILATVFLDDNAVHIYDSTNHISDAVHLDHSTINNPGTTAEVVVGGFVQKIAAYNNARINMSGGSVGGAGISNSIALYQFSEINMSNGTTNNDLDVYDNATANITGGVVGNNLQARQQAHINMSGGEVRDGAELMGDSTFNMTGGYIREIIPTDNVVFTMSGGYTQHIQTNYNAIVYLDGSDFIVTDLNNNSTMLSVGDKLSQYSTLVQGNNDHWGGSISGVLADGTLLDIPYSIFNMGDREGVADIIIRPEPTTVTSFYSFDPASSKLVQFDSDPSNSTVLDITDVETVGKFIDLSDDNRLFATNGRYLIEVDINTGATLDSMQVHPNNGMEGVAVNSEGLVYAYVDHNADIVRIDFDNKTMTTVMDLPYDGMELDNIDFDSNGNLIQTDLNQSGNLYRIPLDGSYPEIICNFEPCTGGYMTFSNIDNAFYFLPNGQELWRLDWSNGQPVGSPYFVKNIGGGSYQGIAAIPEPSTPPVADANGPYTIYVGDTLTLDASGSIDDDNDIVSYLWDLDDDGVFETDAGDQAIFDVNYTNLQSLGLLVNHTYNIYLQVIDSQDQNDVNNTTLTIVPKPPLAVAVDIKPCSCPNPMNVKSKGVLPAAVLGSQEFDVTAIDPTSIQLDGVSAIRSNYEDVAAPVLDPCDCNCTTNRADGFLDLTLKFRTQDIVEAIGDVNDRELLPLTLTGVLFEERPIEGADCILIHGRHKPHNKADINKDGIVDMADFSIITENWLKSSIVEK